MNVGDLETKKFYTSSESKVSMDSRIIKSKDKDNPCDILRRKHSFTHIGLMCIGCFNYNIIKYQYKTTSLICTNNNSNDLYSIVSEPKIYYSDNCPLCGSYAALINVDPNIVETISILNKKRYTTKYCCEGHDINNNGYIKFDSTTKIIPGFIEELMYNLPITWYFDTRGYNKYGWVIIRNDYSNYKESMIDILEWAQNLKMGSKYYL